MVDLLGQPGVGNVVVQTAHLADRPVPFLDQSGHLGREGGLPGLGLGLDLLFGIFGGLLLGLLRRSRQVIEPVREQGLAQYKHHPGQGGAQQILPRRAQGEQQGVPQPEKAHQIDGQDRTLYMFGHVFPP